MTPFLAKISLFSFIGIFFVASSASAYQCQLSVIPDQPNKTFLWDGTAPQSWAFMYHGQKGSFNIDAIGLAGHPEYLFSIKWAGKNLFAASQKKDLSDYNLTWQSDVGTSSASLISLACRTAATSSGSARIETID